jgi:hypothetical protein
MLEEGSWEQKPAGRYISMGHACGPTALCCSRRVCVFCCSFCQSCDFEKRLERPVGGYCFQSSSPHSHTRHLAAQDFVCVYVVSQSALCRRVTFFQIVCT